MILYCLLCLGQFKKVSFLKKSSRSTQTLQSCIKVFLISQQFSNVYIRGEANNGDNLVNLQYTGDGYEHWRAELYTPGNYYCLENDSFRGYYLALNIENCPSLAGNSCGCGYAYLATNCTDEAKFIAVMSNGNVIGLQSLKALTNNNLEIYMRLDGSTVTSHTDTGGGIVNAQNYGANGGNPQNYEGITWTNIQQAC